MLQEGANRSEFGLEVALQGINGESGDQGSSSGGASSIIVAVVLMRWPLGAALLSLSAPGGIKGGF
jgi:hypothetical protein